MFAPFTASKRRKIATIATALIVGSMVMTSCTQSSDEGAPVTTSSAPMFEDRCPSVDEIYYDTKSDGTVVCKTQAEIDAIDIANRKAKIKAEQDHLDKAYATISAFAGRELQSTTEHKAYSVMYYCEEKTAAAATIAETMYYYSSGTPVSRGYAANDDFGRAVALLCGSGRTVTQSLDSTFPPSPVSTTAPTILMPPSEHPNPSK